MTTEEYKRVLKEHDELIQEIHDKAKEIVVFTAKKGRATMNENVYVNCINDLNDLKIALIQETDPNYKEKLQGSGL